MLVVIRRTGGRGHFRSRDKDGGHTIRSAIAENPMLYANFTTLCFIDPELLPDCCVTAVYQYKPLPYLYSLCSSTIGTIGTPEMDSADLEAKDAGHVAGAHMDPDRAASPTGLDTIPSDAEFVSVHDRDPGMLADALPPPRGLAPPPSPKPRKSRSRRRGGSFSVEVTQRVRAPSGRGLASERPGSPYVHPQTCHPQTGNPQNVHPQSGHPQTVHPQNSSDNPQWNTRSTHRLAIPPATASGSSDSGTYPPYTLDHRHGSTTPQLATSRREQQTQNRTLTHTYQLKQLHSYTCNNIDNGCVFKIHNHRHSQGCTGWAEKNWGPNLQGGLCARRQAERATPGRARVQFFLGNSGF